MPVSWNRNDVDGALAGAQESARSVLIDFSAAPS